MRISTKGRYGLRAMMELGLEYGHGPVTMTSIADHQDISLKYLHALLATLRSSGLIRSVRGSKGGYTLAKAPDHISVKDILYSLEGSLHPVECVLTPEICERAEHCAARDVWVGLSQSIDGYLATISLLQLMEKEQRANPRARE